MRDRLLADLQAKDNNGVQPAPEPKPAPTLAEFAVEFPAYQATLNKPTELESKRSIPRAPSRPCLRPPAPRSDRSTGNRPLQGHQAV
ncbi:hypothetical protein DB30_08004 [Enhygromyxa salina]|uniref:Uncharacterized protein n=1 Tax=Enhygromyxa salina TaxID=215803 RepID=A0A0C2D019_9BACT|nr:hypothetical protein DB30_08004 [Enhygromyxa salina]